MNSESGPACAGLFLLQDGKKKFPEMCPATAEQLGQKREIYEKMSGGRWKNQDIKKKFPESCPEVEEKLGHK